MKVTYQEIATAARITKRKAELDKQDGLYNNKDLREVAFYIVEQNNAQMVLEDKARALELIANDPQVQEDIARLNREEAALPLYLSPEEVAGAQEIQKRVTREVRHNEQLAAAEQLERERTRIEARYVRLGVLEWEDE